MADNIAITAGSGTNVATDDVSGTHYQVVKLARNVADSSAYITKQYPIPVLMCEPGDILVERVSNTDGASTASTVFGATASVYNHITTVIAYNASATAGYVDLRDGTAGTIIATLPLPPGGGVVTNFPLPLRQPTVNTALAYDVSAALTTVYLTFIGYKSA
jgi:hypothetical protein